MDGGKLVLRRAVKILKIGTIVCVCILVIIEYDKRSILNFFDSIFSVKNIYVQGNNFVKSEEIIKKSGIKLADCIFANNVENVRSMILEIEELKNVVVIRQFPDKYTINVTERKPIAYLKHKSRLSFVDEDGSIFPIKRIPYNKKLAVLTGKNAEKEAYNLFSVLEKFPALKEQIIFCHRISERRWDIQTKSNIIIKLPEKNLLSAISYLEKNSHGNFCFQNGIAIIDLRINDRVIIHKIDSKNRKSNEI